MPISSCRGTRVVNAMPANRCSTSSSDRSPRRKARERAPGIVLPSTQLGIGYQSACALVWDCQSVLRSSYLHRSFPFPIREQRGFMDRKPFESETNGHRMDTDRVSSEKEDS